MQIAKDAEVAKRDAIIQSLKKRLRKEERHGRTLAKRVERIRTFAELSIDGEALPVKVLDALTKEGLRRLTEDTGIGEGEIVYVQRIGGWGRSVVRDLAGIGIRALITPAARRRRSADPRRIPGGRHPPAVCHGYRCAGAGQAGPCPQRPCRICPLPLAGRTGAVFA